MGGYNFSDNQEKLHLAAMRFGQVGNDFWAGPVSSGGASAGSHYDKFWVVTKEQIERHKKAIQSGDPTYVIPDAIRDWPAHGKIEWGESYRLAPYINVSGTASYSPELGDYPTDIMLKK